MTMRRHVGRVSKPVSGLSGRIRSIQRGTISLTGGAGSNTATITAVRAGISILDHLGITESNSTSQINRTHVRLVLTNSTTVTADRDDATSGQDNVVGYQITEYYP